jgi:hypothetical protein
MAKSSAGSFCTADILKEMGEGTRDLICHHECWKSFENMSANCQWFSNMWEKVKVLLKIAKTVLLLTSAPFTVGIILQLIADLLGLCGHKVQVRR